MKGNWYITEMPGYEAAFSGPAYIAFDGNGGGALSFGCVAGTLRGGVADDAIVFIWDGSDAKAETGGHGWAELRCDGSLVGQISFDDGEEADFIARPWETSRAIH